MGAGGGSGEGAAERREGGACTRLMWYIGSHFELRRFAISASSIGSSSSATARFREDCADMVRTRGEGVGMVLMGAACREESTSAMPFPPPLFVSARWMELVLPFSLVIGVPATHSRGELQ